MKLYLKLAVSPPRLNAIDEFVCTFLILSSVFFICNNSEGGKRYTNHRASSGCHLNVNAVWFSRFDRHCLSRVRFTAEAAVSPVKCTDISSADF